MEELTVQIQKPIIPPLVWNKEAVEAYVNEALEKYVGIVYTDDMIETQRKTGRSSTRWKSSWQRLSRPRKMFTLAR